MQTFSEEQKGKDLKGRPYARRDEIKAGDIIELDDGFPCLPAGKQVVHYDDQRDELFVKCACDKCEIANQKGEDFDKNDPDLILTQHHQISAQLEGHTHGRDVYLGIYLT